MTPKHEIEAFIKSFVKDLEDDNVAIFAGAGLSKGSGYVDWPELLRDIAAELGLEVEKEHHDLISLAQFHVNHRKTSDGLAKKILQEFSEQAEPSVSHEVLARLPIRTFWTTNYDTLLEDALTKAMRFPDVKSNIDHLTTTTPRRDAVVFKMHGDVHAPKRAVLYKEQYERYHATHAPFVTALSGDLVSKTFLFIGFSFTDPNLDYVLSRLYVNENKRTHYCFMRAVQKVGDDEEQFAYEKRKLALRIDDLKRFGIQTLLVEDYADIPKILQAIENRFRKKTVFFSGSAEEYGRWTQREALDFVHALSSHCIKANLRVVNGFGWGIGSAVINGALEAIYGSPQRFTERQLVVRPFPQHGENLKALWEQYRQRMVSLAGIAVFLFGNKLVDGQVVSAQGVRREFEIAVAQGLIPIPVGATGYMANELLDEVLKDHERFYPGLDWIVPLIKELGDQSLSGDQLASKVIAIINRLNK
ncbi:MAG: SIR2 family protein [Mitsuaria chitosanitabida]|uniref:SIR2 family protein n=1 Tax=Roseateles chitosanitabidus TaxID=65048 RepID=UPI001B023B88|nr:SIR2 family protein [Roseateles chitosanitabidus]MBO9687080.1 SIR2 family protein [Roseateles chitosanitabidus]